MFKEQYTVPVSHFLNPRIVNHQNYFYFKLILVILKITVHQQSTCILETITQNIKFMDYSIVDFQSTFKAN